MPYYRFSENDILYNELRLHPKSEFFIHSGNVYYNQVPQISGSQTDNITHVPTGYISLYEYNIDRQSDQLIHPVLTKDGSLTSFKTVTTDQYNLDFAYGDTITGSYPLSASISKKYYAQDAYDVVVDEALTPTTYRIDIEALRSTLNYYTPLNPHYQISSSYKDYTTDEINIIRIPSIFYGSSIEKGSVDLKFFISGALAGRAQDLYKNGSLIQTWPTGSYYSGSNVGVILYNEGFMFLYDAPPYKSTYDLSFDGNDFLMVSDVTEPSFPSEQPSWVWDLAKQAAAYQAESNPNQNAAHPSEKVPAPSNYESGLGSNENTKNSTSNAVPAVLASLDPLSDDLTIAAWIKTSASGPIIVFSGQLDAGDWCYQYGLTVESLKLVGYSGGASIASSTTVNDGSWHHVVMTSNKQNITLYIDGAKEATQGDVGSCLAGKSHETRLTLDGAGFPGANALLIGAARTSTIAYYTGLINEISIWTTAMTLQDVKELYNNGCPINTEKHSKYESNLLVWWNFETQYASSAIHPPYYRPAAKMIPEVEIPSVPQYIIDKLGTLADVPKVLVGNYTAWTPGVLGYQPTHTPTAMSCLSSGFKGFGEGHIETYIAGASDVTASWVHWGATGSATDRVEYSSYSLAFNGVQNVPVITMFAYAPKTHLNHSNNYTSARYPGIISGTWGDSSFASYKEISNLQYKNIVSSSYHNYKEPFSKQTYISKIGIYDKDKNLIGTAKLATPLRKREVDEYIFKLKLDI